jgi:hypothetical protein
MGHYEGKRCTLSRLHRSDDDTIEIDRERTHPQVDTILLLATSCQEHITEWARKAYCRLIDENGIELARLTITGSGPHRHRACEEANGSSMFSMVLLASRTIASMARACVVPALRGRRRRSRRRGRPGARPRCSVTTHLPAAQRPASVHPQRVSRQHAGGGTIVATHIVPSEE